MFFFLANKLLLQLLLIDFSYVAYKQRVCTQHNDINIIKVIIIRITRMHNRHCILPLHLGLEYISRDNMDVYT